GKGRAQFARRDAVADERRVIDHDRKAVAAAAVARDLAELAADPRPGRGRERAVAVATGGAGVGAVGVGAGLADGVAAAGQKAGGDAAAAVDVADALRARRTILRDRIAAVGTE